MHGFKLTKRNQNSLRVHQIPRYSETSSEIEKKIKKKHGVGKGDNSNLPSATFHWLVARVDSVPAGPPRLESSMTLHLRAPGHGANFILSVTTQLIRAEEQDRELKILANKNDPKRNERKYLLSFNGY